MDKHSAIFAPFKSPYGTDPLQLLPILQTRSQRDHSCPLCRQLYYDCYFAPAFSCIFRSRCSYHPTHHIPFCSGHRAQAEQISHCCCCSCCNNHFRCVRRRLYSISYSSARQASSYIYSGSLQIGERGLPPLHHSSPRNVSVLRICLSTWKCVTDQLLFLLHHPYHPIAILVGSHKSRHSVLEI